MPSLRVVSPPQPVEVLDTDVWCPGRLEAWRRDGDGWRAYVRWSIGVGAETMLTNESGGQLSPTALEVAMRATRSKVEALPEGFRYHDLRHYFASLLIASGTDVKVVQNRMRHASAKTTLDTYGHMWPDSDDSTRAAVDAVVAPRLADYLRL